MTDRELDALVAEKVMGYIQVAQTRDIEKYHVKIADGKIPAYSTSGDWMLEVVEKMREKGWDRQSFDQWPHGDWRAQFSLEQRPGQTYATRRAYATADTLPRAVCLAALKAVGE